MDRTIQRSVLLLLDGGCLLSMGILQQQHRHIDELLADNQIHTKIRELKDSERISDEHFHLLFPPTDLSQWDATITSRFLKHCTDLEEPQRTIMDELHELRNKGMEMYQQQGMSNEECTSVWKRIVNILEKGKTFLTGPKVGEIDETVKRIKQEPVTPEDMDRVNNWYDSETKYDGTDTSYPVLHDAAYHGKISTLKSINDNFPDRLLEQDKDGNQAVHFAAEGGNIDCLRYLIGQGLDPYQKNKTHGHTILYKAIMGNCVEIVEYICQEYSDLLFEPDINDCMPIHIAATRNPHIGRCLIKSGVDIALRNKDGMNALHVAANEGSVDFIRMIFNESQDKEVLKALIKARSNDGLNVGHGAVSAGYLHCLNILIEYGLDPLAKSEIGCTLLHTAARAGFLYIVQYLSETYPELKYEPDDIGMGALFSAVHGKSPECLKYLISQGLNTDTRSKYGGTLLHEATFTGSVPMVRYIWETFPEFEYERDKKGMDALHTAVRGGSLDCVIYLIVQGMQPDTRCKYGATILHEAAYGRDVSMVRYIYETFPELINVRDTKGQDAIHYAALGGSLKCLKYFISQGMNTDTRSENGDTLLHEAAYGGYVSMVRYICETFPALKQERNEKRQYAHHSAAVGGSLDCLKYLISQGMKLDLLSQTGNTILQEAAYGGSVSMVRYICETFPQLKKERNENGRDALYSAAGGGRLDCLRYLIDQGMNTDTRSNNGDTLLHAAAHGGSVSMVRYIWKTFPELKKEKNMKGHDALYCAILGRNLDSVKYLSGQGMNTDTRSEDGDTLLHAAAYDGSVSMVRYILRTLPELKEEINAKGQDAIQCAARGKSIECLKYLISQGMNTNTLSENGDTCLHAAAYGGSVSMVRYIWERYPELKEERNSKGQDALYSAALGGSLECLNYLIGQGMKTGTRSKIGNTLLHAAAYAGSVSMVRYILKTLPDLKKETNTKRQYAIHFAAFGGSLDCLIYLISQGMKDDTRCVKGRTVLHEAALGGSVSMVQYIWETFPDLQYETDNKGKDALLTAVRGGNVDCVIYLIGQGMKIDTRCKQEYTLLHGAAYEGSVRMVQYIWETFPELKKVRNGKGQDALYSAACGGSLDCLIYLIGQGMKIDTQSKYGQSILNQAVYGGHASVVRYLCEHYNQHRGYTQADGQTAMFSAVYGGHLDILQYLLSQEPHPELTNKKGHTILHAAARNGKTDIVRYLCSTYKFLIPLKAINGETAIALAFRNRRFDCVQVLEERF